MAGNTQTDDVADRLEKQPPQVGAAAAAAELTSVVSTPSHDADDDGDDREEYLEGGLHAWLTVAGSFLVYFASFGVVNSFGFFQTFYEKSYLTQYSPTAISFIGTLQITLMYLSGPIAGALFDRYGLKVSTCLLKTSSHPTLLFLNHLTSSPLVFLPLSTGKQLITNPAPHLVALPPRRPRRRRVPSRDVLHAAPRPHLAALPGAVGHVRADGGLRRAAGAGGDGALL